MNEHDAIYPKKERKRIVVLVSWQGPRGRMSCYVQFYESMSKGVRELVLLKFFLLRVQLTWYESIGLWNQPRLWRQCWHLILTQSSCVDGRNMQIYYNERFTNFQWCMVVTRLYIIGLWWHGMGGWEWILDPHFGRYINGSPLGSIRECHTLPHYSIASCGHFMDPNPWLVSCWSSPLMLRAWYLSHSTLVSISSMVTRKAE